MLALAAAFLTFSQAYAAETPIIDKLLGPKAAAHRGGTFSTGSNTLEQFKYAQSTGIDVIEMDLRLTKDGVPVVIHDAILEDTTNCRGKVSDHFFVELRHNCRVGSSNRKIPSFEEVLAWNNGVTVLNAELKENAVILPAIRLIQKYNAYESVFFQTRNDRDKYEIARAFDSRVALLYQVASWSDLDWALRLDDDRLVVIEIFKEMATKKVINAIHLAGKAVLIDSFRLGILDILWGKDCRNAYELGIDLPVSELPGSCVSQQRDFIRR